ncbi:hypothetical protein EBR66_04480 [bacterium]|nr:hypothetical protein [bacterium]
MDETQKKTTTGDENLGLVGPDSFFVGTIPYHHADLVRQMLLAAAALIILTVPLFSDISVVKTSLELMGAIVLALCGALTLPGKHIPLFVDAFVGAVGLIIYEPLAIMSYTQGDLIIFVIRESLALLFLFILFFSVKTLRTIYSRTSVVPTQQRAIRADGEEYVGPPVVLHPEIRAGLQLTEREKQNDHRQYYLYDDN